MAALEYFIQFVVVKVASAANSLQLYIHRLIVIYCGLTHLRLHVLGHKLIIFNSYSFIFIFIFIFIIYYSIYYLYLFILIYPLELLAYALDYVFESRLLRDGVGRYIPRVPYKVNLLALGEIIHIQKDGPVCLYHGFEGLFSRRVQVKQLQNWAILALSFKLIDLDLKGDKVKKTGREGETQSH